jgi:hypothetical protein
MSALASCGHNAKSGFVSIVPLGETYAVQQNGSSDLLVDARVEFGT